MIVLVLYLKRVLSLGHRPVIAKRALIGSKGEWILSTIFMLKEFRDWSIIKLQESIHIITRRVYICCTF